jgi:eukaryotic-like serine/threonine-protein kinase
MSTADSSAPPGASRRTSEQAFGRYRLLSRLGEGGMAEVFKAKSFGVEGFEKVLVIKRILPQLAVHGKFVDMFVHEAKLAVRLSHANIVQVFDLGRVDHASGDPTSYFIAMEYVPGLDLATLLARCRKQKIAVPLGMAVFITAEVAKALDHAHRRRDEQSRPLGIVHRDISPQNILLSWEGEVKVTDFGIAKAKDSIIDEEESDARPGRVRGKLAYMSPEQSQAQRLDGRSDIFSLGTVLYEMIAGNNPFVAPTQFETLRRVQASEFPPLEILRADTPKPLVEIVGTMLAKKPDDRFADAGKLHEQLLGYFYATGERFGSNKLAEFLERFHEDAAGPELSGEVVFSERDAANERTPVEVPSPNQDKTGTRTGSGTSGFRLTGGDALITRTAEIGERREVTALVLSFFGADRGCEGEAGGAATLRARACDVLARYGAAILEDEPAQTVALFGLGDADGRDTEAAVRAALVILRARTRTTIAPPAPPPPNSQGGPASLPAATLPMPTVAVSAGVAVARILVDPQGTPIRDERLASLVASAQALARATEGQVAASHVAARIIRSEFSSEDLPGAGMTAPEGGRIITSARAPSAVYGRFVGRHDELKRLGDILAAATKRRPQLVSIQGDKGIGKTRMVAEMERRLAKGNYNVGFYVSSCPKNGAEAQWSGLAAMLRVLCGIQEGDDEARILDVLPRLRALGLTSNESSAVLAQLGAALAEPGLKLMEDASAALRGAFSRMVTSLCDDRLHVFVFDDAHAIDRATLETILAIAGRGPMRDASTPPSSTGGLRAVFIFATRDDPPEPLARHPLHHALALGELSDDDSARLISTRVGARVLLPELLAFCRDRAGGHPLFLEELIKELTDSGALSVLNGAVRAKLDGATAVPRTLRTLIAGRVSRLDPGDRAVLQAASILGEPILTDVLAALTKQSVTQLTRTLSNLFARDFLRINGPTQVCFASPIHGEIVLDAIPHEARRELHAEAAEAFVQTMGEDGIDQAERIAHHLYEAGDRDRAATFYARAALHKMRMSQLEPGIRLLLRALDLCAHDQRSAGELCLWLSALADAVSRVRAAPDLPSASARVLARVDAAGTTLEKVSARVDVARALSAINLFDAAYAKLDEAFALAGDDTRLVSDTLSVEIEITGRSGEFARGTRAADRLISLGPVLSSRTLLAICYVRAASGDPAAALLAIDAAERLDRKDDLMAAAGREKQRVLVHLNARDYKAASLASGRAIDLARSAGLRYDTAASLHNLGDACKKLGDLPRAYAAFTESKEVAEAAGNERLATLNQMFLAYLDGVSGLPDAQKLLRDLIVYTESRGYLTDARQGRHLLGELLAFRGDVDAARKELLELSQQAKAQGDQAMVDEVGETLATLREPESSAG